MNETQFPYTEYTFSVATRYVGSEIKETFDLTEYFSEEEWKEKSEKEKDAFISCQYEEWLENGNLYRECFPNL